MSQSTITSYISTATVENLSLTEKSLNGNPGRNVSQEKEENPKKRLHSCISSSDEHSICIENDLEEIKNSLDKVVKKEDLDKMVTDIMGKLLIKMKHEIKEEVLKEVRNENDRMKAEFTKQTDKMKTEYNTRISCLSNKVEAIEFDNANLLEKNANLCTELRKMNERLEEAEKMSVDALKKGELERAIFEKKKRKNNGF